MFSSLSLQFQVEDIIRIHGENCESHFNGDEPKEVLLSLDGVSESKSTSILLDVYSLKFVHCRDIFPIKIVRPLAKNSVDQQKQLSLVLSAVLRNNLVIRDFVADNPKRSFLRLSLQFSAKFGCEYCFSCGSPCTSNSNEANDKLIENIRKQKEDLNEQIQNLIDNDDDITKIDSLRAILKNLDEAEKIAKKQNKHCHIVWPATTSNGEPRTKKK